VASAVPASATTAPPPATASPTVALYTPIPGGKRDYNLLQADLVTLTAVTVPMGTLRPVADHVCQMLNAGDDWQAAADWAASQLPGYSQEVSADLPVADWSDVCS
jgi:hypothetical protein